MNGKIVTYCPDVSAGVIRDSAQRNYLFNLKQWRSGPFAPQAGAEVLFELLNGWAFDVTAILLPPEIAAKAMFRRA